MRINLPKPKHLFVTGLILVTVGLLALTRWRLQVVTPLGYVSPRGMMTRRADYGYSPDYRLASVTLSPVHKQANRQAPPEQLPPVVVSVNTAQKQGIALEGTYLPRWTGGELPDLGVEMDRVHPPYLRKHAKRATVARVNEGQGEITFRMEIPWIEWLTAGEYELDIHEFHLTLVDGQRTLELQPIAKCQLTVLETDTPVPNRERIAQDEIGE